MSLIVKMILLEWASSSTAAAGKIQYFAHLSSNSILQLINGILSNFQKLLHYFNSTAIVRVPFAPSTTVFPIHFTYTQKIENYYYYYY